MAGIDVSYDENGPRLTVWFGPPSRARRSEARGPDIILKKDADGHVIGVEHLRYFDSPAPGPSDSSRA